MLPRTDWLIAALAVASLIANEFGTDTQRHIWRAWKGHHPEVRNGPFDASDDGAGTLPQSVIDATISALDQFRRSLRTQVDSHTMPEDEETDLGNDMAEIASVERVIRAA
jgi:hypothetical protein